MQVRFRREADDVGLAGVGDDAVLAYTREAPAGWTGHTGHIDAALIAGAAPSAVVFIGARLLGGPLLQHGTSPRPSRTRTRTRTRTAVGVVGSGGGQAGALSGGLQGQA